MLTWSPLAEYIRSPRRQLGERHKFERLDLLILEPCRFLFRWKVVASGREVVVLAVWCRPVVVLVSVVHLDEGVLRVGCELGVATVVVSGLRIMDWLRDMSRLLLLIQVANSDSGLRIVRVELLVGVEATVSRFQVRQVRL